MKMLFIMRRTSENKSLVTNFFFYLALNQHKVYNYILKNRMVNEIEVINKFNVQKNIILIISSNTQKLILEETNIYDA